MPEDIINALLARCYAAIKKDGAKFPDDDFSISRYQSDANAGTGIFEWFVGYRNSGDWKNNAQGSTIQEALETWLNEYENHYPINWDES